MNVLKRVVNEIFSEYLSVVSMFSVDDFLASGMDPFRFGFNVQLFGLRDAIRKELEHKLEMKLENLFGHYHEKYLGYARHLPSDAQWRIVGRGEIPGIDIANDEKKWYLQIKNKFNSMNSSSSQRLASQLRAVVQQRPGALVGTGWVIAGSRRACIGENYIAPVAQIFKGNSLYEFVTGNPNEMKEALDIFKTLVERRGQEHDFHTMTKDAVDRVTDGLETRAKTSGLSVIDYLYRNATQ